MNTAQHRLLMSVRTRIAGSYVMQKTIAQRIGVSARVLSQALNGHTVITLKMAEGILDVLGYELTIVVNRKKSGDAVRAVSEEDALRQGVRSERDTR